MDHRLRSSQDVQRRGYGTVGTLATAGGACHYDSPDLPPGEGDVGRDRGGAQEVAHRLSGAERHRTEAGRSVMR